MQPIEYLIHLLMGNTTTDPSANGTDILSFLQSMGGGTVNSPSVDGTVTKASPTSSFSGLTPLGMLGILAPQAMLGFTPQRFSTPDRTMLAPSRGDNQNIPQQEDIPIIPSLVTNTKARAGGMFPTTGW